MLRVCFFYALLNNHCRSLVGVERGLWMFYVGGVVVGEWVEVVR